MNLKVKRIGPGLYSINRIWLVVNTPKDAIREYIRQTMAGANTIFSKGEKHVKR